MLQHRRMKLWIYSPPFAGKSTLADHFPDPIFLSTDGNIGSYTAPVIEIKAEYVRGLLLRQPWRVFTDAIDDLARGNHSFKTVVVDLVEDTFEHCRVDSCKNMGIEHESDNNFKAWDYVSLHFLDAMKKLTTLDMNVVLLSHADTREIIRRGGDKITITRPNIRDRVANKLAGMVDIVTYLDKNDKGRQLILRSNDGLFSGGRLMLKQDKIECTYDAIAQVYNEQYQHPQEGMVHQGVSPSKVVLSNQSVPFVATQGQTAPLQVPAAKSMIPQGGIPNGAQASAVMQSQGQYVSTIRKEILGNSSSDSDIPF